jgi:ADP-ribosylglycohydrolase
MGCLVGAAIGDALGAGREGREMLRSEDIVSLAERTEQLIYTDDTHMTIKQGLRWKTHGSYFHKIL